MTTPARGPRGGNSGSGARKSRAGVWIFLGFVFFVAGCFLVALNYSNNPTAFNIGLGLMGGGALMALIPALRRDRRHNGRKRA